MDNTPDAVPEQPGSSEIEPSQALLAAQLARTRAELARYRELIAALPSIYEGKFSYQRQVLDRDLQQLREEEQELLVGVQRALEAAAVQRQLPPAVAVSNAPPQRLRLRRRQHIWRRSLRRRLRRRLQSLMQQVQHRREQLRRRRRHWHLQRQRHRRRQQRRLAMAVVAPPAPQPTPTPSPLRPTQERAAAPQAAAVQAAAPQAGQSGARPDAADTTQTDLPPFGMALEALLAAAPPAAYPRACALYFQKFSIEESLRAGEQDAAPSRFSTFIHMDPQEQPTQEQFGFSVVNWTEEKQELRAFSGYLASHWDLHPEDLLERDEPWFRGQGQAATFTLKGTEISPAAAIGLRQYNAASGDAGSSASRSATAELSTDELSTDG